MYNMYGLLNPLPKEMTLWLLCDHELYIAQQPRHRGGIFKKKEKKKKKETD